MLCRGGAKTALRTSRRLLPGLRLVAPTDFLANGSLCRLAKEAPGDKSQKVGMKERIFSPFEGWLRHKSISLTVHLLPSQRISPHADDAGGHKPLIAESSYIKLHSTTTPHTPLHHPSKRGLRSMSMPDDPLLLDFFPYINMNPFLLEISQMHMRLQSVKASASSLYSK